MKRKDDPNILANHYTTAEQYIDPHDGQTKQFTIIDHDVKKKFFIPMTEEEKKALKESLDKHQRERIEEILAMPAVNAVMQGDPFLQSTLYNEFVTRTPEGIKWDENMVRNTLSVDTDLARNLHQRVWRYTVPEEYWFEELTHEEMIEGSKWRKWGGLD